MALVSIMSGKLLDYWCYKSYIWSYLWNIKVKLKYFKMCTCRIICIMILQWVFLDLFFLWYMAVLSYYMAAKPSMAWIIYCMSLKDHSGSPCLTNLTTNCMHFTADHNPNDVVILYIFECVCHAVPVTRPPTSMWCENQLAETWNSFEITAALICVRMIVGCICIWELQINWWIATFLLQDIKVTPQNRCWYIFGLEVGGFMKIKLCIVFAVIVELMNLWKLWTL